MGEEIFKLFGVLALKGTDEVNSEIDETTGHAEKGSSKISSAFKKIAAAAATYLSVKKIVDFGKACISAYADYEQLVGGSQLLFGDAYDFVAEKAKKAYSTVQLSQNDYLKQVNGFATGLKTSLGGNVQAAAELADKIVQAEADVVAATGNTQENVQNAFNGIMKSNYTMLDNLQLGIKPTKEGMEEVIKKVNQWNKANGNATKYQIDNLADCQSALVDYIEMQGLAGYAANEAAGTIQGSWTALKGSWQNLLVGFADGNQNIDELVKNTIDSAGKVISNIIPRIKQVLSNIKALLPDWAQNIIDNIEKVIEKLLGSVDMVKEKFNELKQFYEEHKELIDSLIIILGSFALAFGIVEGAIALYNIVTGIATAVTTGFGVAMAFLTSPIGLVILAIGALIAIGVLLYKNWDKIKAKAVEIFSAVKDFIGGKIEDIKNKFFTFINWIGTKFLEVKEKITSPFKKAAEAIGNIWSSIKSVFKLPHFKFSGSLNPLNWLTDGLPKIGVEWYAKGGILNKPTVFGINPSNGKQMAGGEAGPEAVTPIDVLLGYVRTAVSEQNTILADKLERLIDILLAYFPQFKELMNQPIVADDGTIIAHYAPGINEELRKIQDKEERGS